jgi:hypothetical protein
MRHRRRGKRKPQRRAGAIDLGLSLSKIIEHVVEVLEAKLQKRIAVVILALCSFLALGTSSATAQTPTGQTSLRGAEPFEGFWAKTKEECLDEEGPNSRTIIDLNNMVSGKPAPIFDQYENHCLIEERNQSGNGTTLSVTCYAFWENFTKRIEGSEAKIKLTQGQKGRLIIDGIPYQRCEARP